MSEEKQSLPNAEAIKDLERGCELYCNWYETGHPKMDSGAMAYALVSIMRQALGNLRESRQAFPN